MTDDYLVVTTAVPNRELAHAIAQALLDDKLAASVQIVGPVESLYWWQDQKHVAEEYLCMCRTTAHCFPALKDAIVALHPYVTPEVTAVPIVRGNSDFLAWIDQYTRSTQADKEGI